MKVSILDRRQEFTHPETLLEIVKRLFPDTYRSILACLDGGRIIALSDPVEHSVSLAPITFMDEEGRRIYERTLRLVMLAAARLCFPGSGVRVEHSIGYGIFIRIKDRFMDQDDLSRLEDQMRRIVREDHPIVKAGPEAVQAAPLPGGDGWVGERTRIYSCCGKTEPMNGALLPSTGYVNAFSLRLTYPGFTLQMPSPANPAVPAMFVRRPKNLSAFQEACQWCGIMKITNAEDINRQIRSGTYRSLIRINEALHDRSIARIADGIHQMQAKAVFIAGPSSSGKTTFSNRLCIHLQVLGLEPVLVSLDDFYRARSEAPLDEDGKIDLEALEALDIPYLKKCIGQLLSGQTAAMPRFDFTTGLRRPEYYEMSLGEKQVILFEGIHALNPVLHESFDSSLICRVYISELTCININDHNRIRTTDARLLSRLIRDWKYRNTSAVETLRMWPSVRKGEEKWIFPYQENVDFVFNSVLHYELKEMKKMAVPILSQIDPSDEEYLIAARLLDILACFEDAPEDSIKEIPPLSLLREFIGGCSLYE